MQRTSRCPEDATNRMSWKHQHPDVHPKWSDDSRPESWKGRVWQISLSALREVSPRSSSSLSGRWRSGPELTLRMRTGTRRLWEPRIGEKARFAVNHLRYSSYKNLTVVSEYSVTRYPCIYICTFCLFRLNDELDVFDWKFDISCLGMSWDFSLVLFLHSVVHWLPRLPAIVWGGVGCELSIALLNSIVIQTSTFF